MAKKRKPVVDLSDRGLAFPVGGRRAVILSFDPNAMTLTIDLYEGGIKVESDNRFPFAHLPKPLKKAIKPL